MILRFDFSVPVLMSSPSISLINISTSYMYLPIHSQNISEACLVTDCMTEHNTHKHEKLPLYTLARLSAAMFYVFHTILQQLC